MDFIVDLYGDCWFLLSEQRLGFVRCSLRNGHSAAECKRQGYDDAEVSHHTERLCLTSIEIKENTYLSNNVSHFLMIVCKTFFLDLTSVMSGKKANLLPSL